MSVFNVLPSGVNTFFSNVLEASWCPFQKRHVVGGVSTPPNSLDDGVVVRRSCGSFSTRSLPSLKYLHHSNTRVCERHFPILLLESVVNFSRRDAVIQTVWEWIRCQPQAFFEKGIRMLPKCWKKCVDFGGEYVEDWHVQVSVWQFWFKKKISPGYIWTTL